MGADANVGRGRQRGQAERQGEIPAAHQHLGRVRQCSGNLVHTGASDRVSEMVVEQPGSNEASARVSSICFQFFPHPRAEPKSQSSVRFFIRFFMCSPIAGDDAFYVVAYTVSHYVFLIAR